MSTIIILIFVVIIFMILFNNFGIISGKDLEERDKAIQNYLDKLNNTTQKDDVVNNSSNMRNVCNFKLVEKEQINETKKTLQEQKEKNEKAEAYADNEFLKAVENVVDLVLSELREQKYDKIKKLLTVDMFNIFKEEVENNKSNNRILKSHIISFEKKELHKIVKNNVDFMIVDLSMKQINYIEDNNGNILSGDKEKIITVNETWSFIRNQDKASDIPWLIDSIHESN